MKKVTVTVDGEDKVDWQNNSIESRLGPSNTQEKLSYMIDYFFGDAKEMGYVGDKMEKGEMLKDKRFSIDKTTDAAIHYTQATALFLNPTSAFVNVTMGTISNFIHAAGETEFTTSQMWRAMNSYFKAATDSNHRKKIQSLMDKYQVLIENTEKGVLDGGFILQKWGEVKIQSEILLASMYNKTIKDNSGKEHSLYDAYDFKDGELVIKPEFSNSGFADINGKSSPQVIEFASTVNETIKRIQGDYDIRSAKMYKKEWWGRAISVFKNWVPRAIESRFGGEKFNSKLNRTTKGRYRSIYENLSNWRDIYALSVMGRMTGTKVNSITNPTDLANIKVTLRELSWAASMYLFIMVGKGLMGDEDDEKTKAVYTYILNTASRVESDISFWASLPGMAKMVKDPVAPMRAINDFVNLVGTTKDWVLGDAEITKVGEKGIKFIPGLRQYSDFKRLATEDFAENLGEQIIFNED
jgi:hypothetical protein